MNINHAAFTSIWRRENTRQDDENLSSLAQDRVSPLNGASRL